MRPKLRVAVVQFAPVIQHVEENVKRAADLCSKLKPDTLDLVCLPEMIFTGYAFPNANAIAPFLEEPQKGPTSQFCAALARKLRCYVLAGFPEVLNSTERRTREDGSPVVGANSAVIYDREGLLLGSYRKTHLFEADRTWATQGDEFKSWKLLGLPSQLQNLSIGICMDLNPRPPASWSLEDGPYELAEYCLSTMGKERTDVLVLLNAWLDSKRDQDVQWDLRTLNYWVARLRPLWDDGDSGSCSQKGDAKETIVVICNRSGADNDTLFAGTSTVMSLREGSGRPEILGLFGRREEDVKIFII